MISIDGAHDKTSSSALAVAPPSLKPRHRLQVARVIRRPHRYHRRHSCSHTPRGPRHRCANRRAADGLASALTALSMARWTLAIGHAAIHGEVQVTTALCVMRSWSPGPLPRRSTALSVDAAIHGEVQVAMVLSVARSRSPSPLPRRRAPWRGRRRPGHLPFVFAAASHGKVEANRGGRRYSLIVRAGSLGS